MPPVEGVPPGGWDEGAEGGTVGIGAPVAWGLGVEVEDELEVVVVENAVAPPPEMEF